MPQPSLKQLVEQTPDKRLTFRFDSIGATQRNQWGKDTRRAEICFPATGKTRTDYFPETNFLYDLNGVQQGDTVEAFIKDNGYLGFRILKATSETIVTPTQTNSAQVRNERQASKSIEEQEEKSIAISLQGYHQQLLPHVLQHERQLAEKKQIDFDLKEAVRMALEVAVMAREACLKKAHQIHTGQLEEKIFGSDPSPQLPEQKQDTSGLPF